MTVSKIFINGCSFLTFRPRDNVNTHCGIELAKLMQLAVEVNLAGGGRGSKRLMWTTRAWCEKFPDKAKDCFGSMKYSNPVLTKKEYLSKTTLENIPDSENLFEALHFKYSGPIDGHDVTQLISELNRLKNIPFLFLNRDQS